MNRVIYDFVNCRHKEQSKAYFEGDQKAFDISSGMSRNQRHNFFRKGVVPACFFTYLRRSGIIQEEPRSPKSGTKIGDLLDFLRWYPYKTEQAKSAGEYLFRQIIKSEVPVRYINDAAFGLGDRLWEESRFNRRRAIGKR